MNIVFKWRTPSKKNQKQIFFNKKTGARFITSSEDYKSWHTEQMWLLKKYKPATPIKKCSIGCCFYFENNRKCDLENKFSSIADTLKDAGIIEDDSWQCLNTIILKACGIDKMNPRIEVVITEIV